MAAVMVWMQFEGRNQVISMTSVNLLMLLHSLFVRPYNKPTSNIQLCLNDGLIFVVTLCFYGFIEPTNWKEQKADWEERKTRSVKYVLGYLCIACVGAAILIHFVIFVYHLVR